MFPTKAAFWQSDALPLSYGAIYPLHNNSQCVYCKVLCLAERVGLEPTSQFPDQRFSRPSDYQLSHLSNMVASGWIRTTDRRLMRPLSYHCYTPQFVPQAGVEPAKSWVWIKHVCQFRHQGILRLSVKRVTNPHHGTTLSVHHPYTDFERDWVLVTP